MRLFLAIKPDRPAEAQLARRLLALQRALGDFAGVLRWTQATNLHATLHFLGELDPGRLGALRESLGDRLPGPVFEISLGEVGVFPEFGTPRVLWLAIVRGAKSLTDLHRELAGRLGRAGIAVEDRPFSPHLTLARVRDRADRRAARHLREKLPSAGEAPISWTADHVTLYRSDLTGPVPRYDPVHEIRLGN